jgi:hypothetical protein
MPGVDLLAIGFLLSLLTSASRARRSEEAAEARLTDDTAGTRIGVMEVLGNGLRRFALRNVPPVDLGDLGEEVIRQPLTPMPVWPLLMVRGNGSVSRAGFVGAFPSLECPRYLFCWP